MDLGAFIVIIIVVAMVVQTKLDDRDRNKKK